MSALGLTILAVVVADQTIKLVLRRAIGNDAFSLGPCVSLRLVATQVWLKRLGGQSGERTMWSIWLAAAIVLVTASALAPLNAIAVGMLLGGSLSHAIESSVRRSVTDYVRLRRWLVFNLADLALAAGAIGIFGELAVVIFQAAF